MTWRCQPTKERPSKWSRPRPVLSSGNRVRPANVACLQPFAIACLRVGMVPQLGQVGGQGQQRVAFGQRRPGRAGGGQSSFGIGERDEFGFPLAFQGAGNEPVFRADVAERPFGAVGFVAGAFIRTMPRRSNLDGSCRHRRWPIAPVSQPTRPFFRCSPMLARNCFRPAPTTRHVAVGPRSACPYQQGDQQDAGQHVHIGHVTS